MLRIAEDGREFVEQGLVGAVGRREHSSLVPPFREPVETIEIAIRDSAHLEALD
jgi:hypothetical protein